MQSLLNAVLFATFGAFTRISRENLWTILGGVIFSCFTTYAIAANLSLLWGLASTAVTVVLQGGLLW